MLLVRIIITIINHEILLQPGSTMQNREMVTINGVQQPAHGDGIIYESNAINIKRCGGYPVVFLKTFGLRTPWDALNN